MPCRSDTSYCRFCCSPINWPCTSPVISLLLRWLLDADDPVQLCQAPIGRRYVSSRRGKWRSCPPPTRSVPTAPNPAFDPKWVLLRRMFFINEDKTKHVSVGYYPARDYQPLVEYGAIRMGGSKCLILADEQVVALADCLPSIRDSMCVGGDRCRHQVREWQLSSTHPRRHGSARLFVGTEYISLTQPDMDYLVRVFHILQQHLRHYISAMPDVLSSVT